MIQKMYSLRQTAKLLSISRKVLRDRLHDLGYHMPDVPQGGKILLSEKDIETIRAALSVPLKTVDSPWRGELSEYIADWHKRRGPQAKNKSGESRR
jgi:hypothetical protein